MLPVEPRAITQHEVAAIREAFAVAPTEGISPPSEATLAELRVVCRCPCGCASVRFVPEPVETSPSVTILADAEGRAPTGEALGLIVWGTPEQITGIEVHWVLTEGAPLPVPGSMRPYGSPGAQ